MSAIASFLARWSWFWMLYSMRRPWIKRLQQRWLIEVPGEPHKRFPESFMRQNRIARKYGLSLLTICYNIFLASVFITLAYYVATYMYETGMFNPPERMIAVRSEP